MATAAAVLTNFGSDNWNAELYESLSLAARLSMAVKTVKTHSHNLRLSYLLWKVNGSASRFFQEVEDIISGKKAVPGPEEPVTPENIQKAISTFMQFGIVIQ